MWTPYNPVSDWIKQVDVVLEDEGQQYSNMEEASTVARTPRPVFEIWSGDRRQTPGGLQQTEAAKMFRRKLLKRPLARRCPTEYIQPHGLPDIAARYLEGHSDSLQETATGRSNMGRISCGTGWASPQLTTYDHYFTLVDFQTTPLSSQ